MPVTAVVGANFGDEGKGRIVDALASEYDYVIRYQGGANAGHTVLHDGGKFVFHQLPSGVFSHRTTNVLGPGVALDIEKLCTELDMLSERGVAHPKLAISDRAQLLLSWHIDLDEYEEERLGSRAFGSTRSGIAPFYADKCAKLGVLVDDLFDEQRLRARLARSQELKNPFVHALYGKPEFDAQRVAASLLARRDRIAPFVCDTTLLLHNALAIGASLLVEGQLGALRDPDHGTYPLVTSSSPLAGFASVGAGIPAASINRVVAVTKAYATCVGAAPFVTEIHGGSATELRNRGGDAGEFGATTGRPRRVGWFDAVATRYGCRVQGATEVALTCLDVLGYLEQIPICTGYRLNGRALVVDEFPTPRLLEQVEPTYEWLPGWGHPIKSTGSSSALPAEARRYVMRLEEVIGVPIRMVSVGPHRNDWVGMN
jgi:adenylosuccinate synthase